MTESVAIVVQPNRYVDSITLLQVSSEIAALGGVLDAAVVMATELNRDLLRDSGLLTEGAAAAGANDLVIAVRAMDDAVARAGIDRAEALLASRPRTTQTSDGVAQAPRSLRAAHRANPEARLAVISVPGQYAAGEARQALADGLNVFLFSDNVSLEDEVDLKKTADDRGLIVMGPDCGTAILSGIGYGFANVVRRGSVGVVGASGTGIQELTCLLHGMGKGISHAIGTGGRDLYAEVGGISSLRAIDLLNEDTQTETIVLVSKPADPATTQRVLTALARTGKRAIALVQGGGIQTVSGVQTARSLDEAATLAAGEAATTRDAALPNIELAREQRQVRGLFCGGTLCQEAASVFRGDHPDWFVDFGDDQYTRGRAHPMIDPTLRNHAIVEAGSDPGVGVILLDVILGLGSHSDPAGAALPAIRAAFAAAAADGRQLAVLAHVIGTELDPQNLTRQEMRLEEAGVHLFASNYAMARAASRLVEHVAV